MTTESNPPAGYHRIGTWPQPPKWATWAVLATTAAAVGAVSASAPGRSSTLVAVMLAVMLPHELLHGWAARMCGARRVRYGWGIWGPYSAWYGAMPARRRAVVALAPQALTAALIAGALLGPREIAGGLMLAAFSNAVGGGLDYLSAWQAAHGPQNEWLVGDADPEVDGLYAPAAAEEAVACSA